MLIRKLLGIESMIPSEQIEKELPKSSFIYMDYWRVALPAALEGVFLNIMLLADLAMVGALGIGYVAAVGISSQPRMIFQMLGMAIGVSLTAIVSRRHGEKKFVSMNSSIKQALLIVGIIYSVFTIIALVYTEEILLLSGAKQEYLSHAIIFFRYIIISSFFRMLFAPLMSAQIGVGNTKVVLKANLIGNITNVILNYIMIFGKFGFPRMEIAGAGLATAIGNGLIFILLLKSVIKGENEVDILQGSLKLDKNFLKPLVSIGSSSFMEHLWERVGLFAFTRMIAQLGTITLGIHHYCILIWDLYYYFGSGMGSASSSFSGRKLGEKRKDLAIIYNKVAQRSGIIISLLVSGIFIVFRREIFSLFVKEIYGIVLGANVLIVIAILIIPQTYAQVSSGTLRGAGDNRFIAIYSMFVSALLRPLFAFILAFSLNLGLVGMWLALLIDEVLKMLLTRYRVNKGIWLDKKV